MNKKGFLFTVFILLFLSALLLFVLAYSRWFDGFQEDLTVVLPLGSQAAFILDDLSQDVLVLQNMQDIAITRSSSNVSVSFSGGINSSVDYAQRFSAYEQFVEQNYSSLIQVPIALDTVSYGFSLPLYGVSSSWNTSNFYVFTQNSSLLKQINVTLQVLNTSAFTSNSTPSANGSDTLVQVRMLDSAGREVYNGQKILSSSASNSPFRVNFSSSAVDVYFQSYSSRTGTLWFDYDSNISILSMIFVYQNLNRTVYVNFNTTATLSPAGDFSQYRALGVEG